MICHDCQKESHIKTFCRIKINLNANNDRRLHNNKKGQNEYENSNANFVTREEMQSFLSQVTVPLVVPPNQIPIY